MSDLSFGRPLLLVALALIPLVYGGWVLASRQAHARAKSVSRASAGRPRYLTAGALALAAALAVTASAQPRWGTEESVIPRRSAEVIFVVDVSRSMDAKDIAPSRLEAVKTAVASTMLRLPGDQIGLVIFAGNGRLRFPLTTDRAAATQVINGLETGPVLVQGGTSAASGLDVAMNAFDENKTGGRLIVFISDGEDLGSDPAAAAARIKQAGVDFIAVGVGTAAGANVPVYDPRTKTTIAKLGGDGKPIVSKLNEPFLKALAVAAGGRYIGADVSALPGSVEGRVSTLKRLVTDDHPSRIPVERFQWFAGAALVLVLLATAGEQLNGSRARPALGAMMAVLAGLLMAGCATEAHDVNQEGVDAFKRGDYPAAISRFIDARAMNPDEPQLSLNLAAALNKAGRFDEASQAARRLLILPDAKTRAQGYASLGHHEFAAGRSREALDAFKHALLENPGDDVSRHDYEVVLRLLQSGQQPQPQQPAPTDPSQKPPQDQPPGQDGRPGTPQQQPQNPQQPQGAQGGNQPAQPGSSQATTPEALERQLAQIDAQVQALIQQAGEEPDAAEALQILSLLAERNRIAAQRDAFAGGGNPNDY